MKHETLFIQLGWPAEKLNHAGQLERASASTTDLSSTKLILTQNSQGWQGSIVSQNLEGSAPLMEFSIPQKGEPSFSVGHPPTPVDLQEALALFSHLGNGLSNPRFHDFGPLQEASFAFTKTPKAVPPPVPSDPLKRSL